MRWRVRSAVVLAALAVATMAGLGPTHAQVAGKWVREVVQ